jgi:putative ABC transport system permease protein
MILFDFAKRNIRLHWLRSLLAVVGIIIGVTAISSMGMLGNSLVLSISDSLTSVGDTIVVTPHISAAPGTIAGGGSSLKITERQVEEIRRAAGANTVVPIHTGAERITVGNEAKTAALYAMDPADVPVLLEKESGIYLRTGTGVMVGKKLAEENNLQVGESLGIGSGEERVRIVGVLKERGIGFDLNPDYAIIVPDTWFIARYGERDYDQVIIKVRKLEDIDGVKAAVEDKLNRREQVVNVLDTRKVLKTIVDAFNQISTFTTAIGGISLVVAGISILNVMLMSVTERTKEIGIIRSLGAKRGEVMRIFLSEALILGLLGSAIGGVLSLAGGYLALNVMLQSSKYLFAASTLVYILYGVAFGIGVSLLSGIYPAWKAAMMNPIEALRFE